jgi:hypothetical protein
MGVNFDIPESSQDIVVANERLWLTADRERVVKDGDPDAAFLLCAEGNELPRVDAERYGLVGGKKQAAAKPKGDEPPAAE